MTANGPVANIGELVNKWIMNLKFALAVPIALVLCSCDSQGVPTSVTLLCKKVNVDNSNAVILALAKAAKRFDYEMANNGREIDLVDGRVPYPLNLENIYGVLKKDGRYVLGFSTLELERNAYALSFYSRTEQEFRDHVLNAVTQAIDSTKSIEFQGNAFNGSQCNDIELHE